MERRKHPRFRFEQGIEVAGHTLQRFIGRIHAMTIDLSEQGIAILLVSENLEVGSSLALVFETPFGEVQTAGIVRNKTGFRYGFEFIHPAESVLDKIKKTCAFYKNQSP
jgi:hypothetical protein